jgi:hypothetical protein
MEIVPTSISSKKVKGLEELILRKKALKEQIQEQKEQISDTSRKAFSPLYITSYVFHSFTKGLNMIDGVVIGYRIARIIRKIFHRSR